ncbi:MAG: mannonate dehydratase [Salaquimonas sp.]|jgi:mannonate dehydratase|nr:mannonate dehydratase [Salaquimonas sp.]
MRQTWRWFGPADTTGIDDMVQAGVEGVVSALHHVPSGAVWTAEEIARRQDEVRRHGDGSASNLEWEVVESLPVSEAIKKQRGEWREHVAAYRESLENLAAAGIETICYNFMPVLDWTRTDLAWRLPHGGTCMRFDYFDFVAFDLFILERDRAKTDYPEDVVGEAERRFRAMTTVMQSTLAINVTCGLPGAADHMTTKDVRAHLAEYDSIDAQRLRRHYIDFLSEVVPTAEKHGLRLCCHPDDPPFPLLGLPRVMSTEDDYRKVMDAVDSPANGITLCAGSLGARPDNDLPGMMSRLGDRVHFLHLRNVKREGDGIGDSFHEAEHLGGDVDMVALIAEVLKEEARRKANGRTDHQIPMRPDHGQHILDDLKRQSQPGYPTVGRLRGLAELRGVAKALGHARLGIDHE